MTPSTLAAAVGCSAALAERYAVHLAEACGTFAVNTPDRLAAFLAQIGHESGGLRYTAELWGPTPAQSRYEGRADLGNTEPGDGHRYAGHGLIQTTGRYNHRATTNALRAYGAPDFEADPLALTEPRWAALSAAWYWHSHGCNELADAGEFERITRKINGGLNGQDDRLKRWEKAKVAIAATSETAAVPPAIAPEITPIDGRTHMLPLIPILSALLPTLIDAVPKLGGLFGSGSEVSERNIKAAETVFQVAQTALCATNAQEVAQRVQDDPAAAQIVRKAVEDNWFQLSEAGGGGIEGARKAEAQAVADHWLAWRSPSFMALMLMLPLVYMMAGAVVGLWGTLNLSAEVTASLITGIVTLVIGSAAGFYWGSTTTKNKPGGA